MRPAGCVFDMPGLGAHTVVNDKCHQDRDDVHRYVIYPGRISNAQ